MSEAFGWYTKSNKVEIVDSKDLLAQLEASKPSIKDLFKDLLNKMKGFKYQITVKVLLRKHKGNGERTCFCLFQFYHKNSDSFKI